MKEFEYENLYSLLSVLTLQGHLETSEKAVDDGDRETLVLLQAELKKLGLTNALKLARRLPTEFQDNSRSKRELFRKTAKTSIKTVNFWDNWLLSIFQTRITI